MAIAPIDALKRADRFAPVRGFYADEPLAVKLYLR